MNEFQTKSKSGDDRALAMSHSKYFLWLNYSNVKNQLI